MKNLSKDDKERLEWFRRLPKHDKDFILEFFDKVLALPESERGDYFKKGLEHIKAVCEIMADLRDGD